MSNARRHARKNSVKTPTTLEDGTLNRANGDDAEARALKILDLRAAGMSFDNIAKQLGYNGRGAVHNAFRKILEKRRIEAPEEFVRLQLVRYDKLLAALTPKVLKGDASAVLASLRVMEAMNKLYNIGQTPVFQFGSAGEKQSDIDRVNESLDEFYQEHYNPAALEGAKRLSDAIDAEFTELPPEQA